jgi:hypothetical protein
MNWYKIAQTSDIPPPPPIRVVSYFPKIQEGELGISFNGGKKYVYPKVPNPLHERIERLLGKKNYKAVEKILRNLTPNKPKPETPQPEPPKKEPPKKEYTQLELF